MCRLQLKCDGTRWRTGGEVKGKLANAVGSQHSSHYLGTWCTQHYYSWCAHLGCQQSTELTPPGRFKWTRPFRAEDEIWFLRVCRHISTGLYIKQRVGFKRLTRYITNTMRVFIHVHNHSWQHFSSGKYLASYAGDASRRHVGLPVVRGYKCTLTMKRLLKF